MGGGQSKPATVGPEPTTMPPSRASLHPGENQSNRTDSAAEAAAQPKLEPATAPSSPSSGGDGSGGGGCPMKLEGGGYRFGGWLGGGGGKVMPKGHPIVDTVAGKSVAGREDRNGGEDAVPKPAPESKARRADSGRGGGCPMKLEGGGYRFGGWLGGGGGKGLPKGHPLVKPITGESSSSGDEPGGNNSAGSGGGGGGGCPVKGDEGSKPGQVQYNVYSQPIDPSNMMPAVANQLPNPLQRSELSTDRLQSTIPKGGASDGTTWIYPSSQMFLNSLARKGKLTETDESVVESVVALHNNMNEKTWAKVREWEAATNSEGEERGGPKLLRFMGRPSDLSPKARFKSWVLGHPLPFDRHDWTVVRPDGTEVRYVIDYYHDESRAREDEDSAMPSMHDREAVRSILVDVRPALDGPRSVVDRAWSMPYARHVGKSTEFEPLPMVPTPALREQVGESRETWETIQKNAKKGACKGGDDGKEKTIVVGKDDDKEAEVKVSREEAQALSRSVSLMMRDCLDAQKAVDACEDEAESARLSLALTMCMGKVVCPLQHNAVTRSLNADHDPNDEKAVEEYNLRLDKALENVSACVVGVSERAAIARMVYPDVFKDKDA